MVEAPKVVKAPYFTLNNGCKMPALGLGTYMPEQGDKLFETVKTIVKAALLQGYRFIDTASFYFNEEAVGAGIEEAMNCPDGPKREDIFVLTKIWHRESGEVEKALRLSLERLKLSYVDMYIIHWPLGEPIDKEKGISKKRPLHELWRDLELMVDQGLCKGLGVSNFNYQLLLDLLSYAKIPPAINEIELHCYNPQTPFVKWMLNNGIVPVGYSPLTNYQYIFQNDLKQIGIQESTIQQIAASKGCTNAQLLLAWGIARGYAVLPKTSKLHRLKENYECIYVELEREEILKIEENIKIRGRTIDPARSLYQFFGNVPCFQ